MILFTEIFLSLFNVLVVLLSIVAVIFLFPVMVQLIHDEILIKFPKKVRRKHRIGMINANDLAQKFLAQKYYRETDQYKLDHPAIAGKRA